MGCVRRDNQRFELVYAETITARGDSFFSRLKFISRRLSEVLDDLRPREVAIESTFFGKNAHSAFQLGTARGVAIGLCLQRGLSIFEYAPAKVKSVVTGYGRADKDDVRKHVELALGQRLEIGHDATDALAIAICHASSIDWTRGKTC